MPRRAWGSGSLYQRANGRWEGSVSDGRGGRQYVTGTDKATVARRLRELVRSERSRRPSDQATADFLDRWHRDNRKRLRPQTWEMYGSVLRTHVIPWCGRIPIGKLRPQDVEAMLTGMMAAGLSAQRAKHAHVVLRAALSDAVRWELVPTNIAKAVKSPRVVMKHPPTIEPSDAMRLLSTLTDHPYRAVFVLGMFAGMRQGEILALDWSDLDFDAGVIHVRHTLRYVPRTGGEQFSWDAPKTDRSVRDLPMSALLRSELERHRRHATSVSMVFARWDGRPLLRQDVTRKWRAALTAAGIEPVPFHSARHWFAGMVLEATQGDLRAAQAFLGHESITTTVNRYGGIADAAKKRASVAMDVLLTKKEDVG